MKPTTTTANHEIEITCPVCGYEYDARRHGWANCPNCNNIKK